MAVPKPIEIFEITGPLPFMLITHGDVTISITPTHALAVTAVIAATPLACLQLACPAETLHRRITRLL